MKRSPSFSPFFGLLGGALVLSGGVAFAQSNAPKPSDLANLPLNPSIGTAAIPQQKQVHVRVELLDMESLDQQEFFGTDEPFAMWVFSAMRDGIYDPKTFRAETYFGVSQPITLNKGERKTISAGKVIFDGVLSEGSALSGTLMAMEEDDTREWNDALREELNAKVLARINTEKNMRENTINSDHRPATNADLSGWTKMWWERSAPGTYTYPFDDHDDVIATTPLEARATGAMFENRGWRAEGDGAVYELRYRITRTPIEPTAPQPNTPSLPQLPVPTTPTAPTNNLSTWADEWQTTYGRVKLALENGVLRGQLFLKNQDGSDKPWDHLELRAGSAPGQLVGTSTTRTLVTQVTLTLSPDGQSFTATGQLPGQALYKWSGKRQRLIPRTSTDPASSSTSPVIETLPTPNTSPAQNPLPTVPAPLPTVPVSPAPTTSPSGSSGFLPLKYFGVRVDRVQPNIAGDALEVDCTFKNREAVADNINSSMIRAVATDADGVGYLNDPGFYRLSADAQRMDGNREVASQGELKARLLVSIAPGSAPLKTLTLWETSSPSQTVDISNVQWPGSKPAANLSTLKLSGANPEFRACGETLDVRFDGFRKARGGNYEAFFTFKNMSDALTRNAVLELHRGSFDVFTLGDDGAKQPHSELARAGGEGAVPIVTHYAILPGGETRVRYTFSSKDDVPNPIKVAITDRVSKTTLDWSVVAK